MFLKQWDPIYSNIYPQNTCGTLRHKLMDMFLPVRNKDVHHVLRINIFTWPKNNSQAKEVLKYSFLSKKTQFISHREGDSYLSLILNPKTNSKQWATVGWVSQESLERTERNSLAGGVCGTVFQAQMEHTATDPFLTMYLDWSQMCKSSPTPHFITQQ